MGKERLTVIELVVILTKNKLRRSALDQYGSTAPCDATEEQAACSNLGDS